MLVGIVVIAFAIVEWYFNWLTPARGEFIIQTGTGGTTDPSPGMYEYNVGQIITIIAIPDHGYSFARWEPAGIAESTSLENSVNVTVEEGTVTYKARFDLTNLLRNPSVEDDEDSDGEPDHWFLKEAGTSTDEHIWSTDAYTGARSLEIHITNNDTLSPTAFSGWRQQFDLDYPANKSGYSPIERGKTYRFRGWGKAEGAELRIAVVIWSANYSALVAEGTGVTSPLWTQSSWASFTVPLEARFVAIGAVIMQKNIELGFTTAWARADDFELLLMP